MLGVVTGSDLVVGDVLLDINGESVKGEPPRKPWPHLLAFLPALCSDARRQCGKEICWDGVP